MLFLMIMLRPRRQSTSAMPTLAIRRTGPLPSARKRNSTSKTKNERAVPPKQRKKAKPKKASTTIALDPKPSALTAQAISLETCPSCGLQAPGNLLAEHFMGSPGHRNGPPKMVVMEAAQADELSDAEEEDSKQSVRNLLQILVPPRAFGHRHGQKSVSPITSIVRDAGHMHRQL